MIIHFHPHAEERMKERNATEEEVAITVQKGESFPAKYGRIGFRHNFIFRDIYSGYPLLLEEVANGEI